MHFRHILGFLMLLSTAGNVLVGCGDASPSEGPAPLDTAGSQIATPEEEPAKASVHVESRPGRICRCHHICTCDP